MALDTITPEEFNQRLDAANARQREQVREAEERLRRLNELIQRKEAFVQKLDRILIEIERDEAEIAAAEKHLRTRRVSRRSPVAP
jgi:predicted phage gp36 major capsid-like protein